MISFCLFYSVYSSFYSNWSIIQI